MNDESERNYLGPERLLLELSVPFPQNVHGQLAMQGATALDPIQRFMVKAGGSFEDGRQPAAMLHLFSRSITDIVAGLQLLSHCYLQQAHSVIRPVRELRPSRPVCGRRRCGEPMDGSGDAGQGVQPAGGA